MKPNISPETHKHFFAKNLKPSFGYYICVCGETRDRYGHPVEARSVVP